jgi:hypothetical protein
MVADFGLIHYKTTVTPKITIPKSCYIYLVINPLRKMKGRRIEI